MDKIKFRFLNYKHYDSFQTALRDGRILDDSIVFIQDKNCIWARGKEYVCDGPYTTDTDVDGNVTLKEVTAPSYLKQVRKMALYP